LENNGRALLDRYGNSPSKAVIKIYSSDHTFLPWLFEKSASGYFRNAENRRKFLSWLKQKVGVENDNDLQTNHFVENSGLTLLKSYGMSTLRVIQSLNTDYDEEMVLNSKEASQRLHRRNFWVRPRISLFPLL
jgi:hypothetical protein